MFESKINRGRANGYAPLGSTGKVPLDYLPPIQSTLNTGSFATTGSNTFTGVQTLAGTSGTSWAELNIGQTNIFGNYNSYDIRATGSSEAGITLTSGVVSIIGVIGTDYSEDASTFANSKFGYPYSDGPIAAITVQKSGSFSSNWLFDYDGKSYFPGDVNIGYNTLNGLTSGSLNITKGNISVSGSVNISSSLVVAASVVSNGSINALNSDLIIDGGDIILSGSMYFGSGSSITETSSSITIKPAGAAAGQSLVVRPTAGQFYVSSSHPDGFVPGESTSIYVSTQFGNGTGTLDYQFTGATAQQLGRAINGTLTFSSESEKNITWNIPAQSSMTTFTFSLISGSGFTAQGGIYVNSLPNITVTLDGSAVSENNHIHLVSGDPSMVDIYLGDDDNYVKVEKNAGDVVIGTNLDTNRWRFDTSGSLILPNDMVIDASVDFGILQIGGDGTYIKIDDGGAPPSLTIATNGGENEWVFGLDGNLTTPGDIVLSGSFAQQVNYAPMGSGSYEETPEGEVTELDITKDIHLIDITGIEGNSHYYLPNGLYDGQVVRLALKGDDIASPNNVYVWVESLRTDTGAGTQFVDWLPFFADTPRSLATAVWIGGSWNIDNSHFGMW